LPAIKGDKGDPTPLTKAGIEETLTGLVSSHSHAPIAGNPNLLINGDFQVWQRGDTLISTGYTADRWYAYYYGGQTVSKIDNTSPAPVRYAARIFRTSTADFILLNQPIEAYDTLGGYPCTLSFWAKGYGGYSGLLTVLIGGSTLELTITSTWARYELHVDSFVEGTNIGSKGIVLQRSVLAGQGIEIAAVKFELGSVATPFIPRPYAEELALCRRYYQKGYFSTQGCVNDAGILTSFLRFSKMRAIPTLAMANVKYYTQGNYSTNQTVNSLHNQSDEQTGFNIACAMTTLGYCASVVGDYSLDAEIY
jgi:hypothetical protein